MVVDIIPIFEVAGLAAPVVLNVKSEWISDDPRFRGKKTSVPVPTTKTRPKANLKPIKFELDTKKIAPKQVEINIKSFNSIPLRVLVLLVGFSVGKADVCVSNVYILQPKTLKDKKVKNHWFLGWSFIPPCTKISHMTFPFPLFFSALVFFPGKRSWKRKGARRENQPNMLHWDSLAKRFNTILVAERAGRRPLAQ